MQTLELDKTRIYKRVLHEAAQAQVAAALSTHEVQFLTDVILEEMRRQYLEGTGRV